MNKKEIKQKAIEIIMQKLDDLIYIIDDELEEEEEEEENKNIIKEEIIKQIKRIAKMFKL